MAYGSCVYRGCRQLLGFGLRGHRLSLYTEQRCGFRRAPKKNEPRKKEIEEISCKDSPMVGNRTTKSSLSPPLEEPILSKSSARSFRKLFKPFLFTVGFTGSTFGAAAIWQYESLKSRVQSYYDDLQIDWFEKHRPPKAGDVRKQNSAEYWHRWWGELSDIQKQAIVVLFQVNQWWNSLTDGQRSVTGIIAANVLVFCLWRIPSMQRIMMKYFTSNPASKTLCLPMILSTFSHFSLFHMGANMYVLWSFSSSIVSLLGQEQFMAVYFSAGVISTFVSYVCKTASGRFGPSLGASGAIMSVLAAVCTKMPEAKLAIIFLPMFTFTAGSALKAIVALDTTGLILGWKFFDHAAHLGGALFGIWYIVYGHEMIWKNREPLVKVWHEMRTKSRGSGGNGPA
ncbi:presenilins-associated rhomboid-like protein, mitochondrial isoform X1 [Callorhinchus milii]|uniref:presenilins-associated rhomboid-like protein, mitochondrial isoform X1 n=1 Tax=Callorhinchus milii TaxID=7868 RepID=UPI001C3FC934|nr:presenilins-associated rhomboid-like protein, mitochondrial isoform X1 [Callorhinchus milii]